MGNVSEAARIAGVNRTTPDEWRAEDRDFEEAWESALEEAADELEKEARRRAVEGVDEPVYYQGEVVGSIKKFSDVLLIFLIKGARPAKYRERFDVRHSSNPESGKAGAFARALLEEGESAVEQIHDILRRARDRRGDAGDSRLH